MIHVYIEKGKNFKVPEDSTIDPMFCIETLGRKEYTKAKDDIDGVSEVVYDEHIFIEARNVDKREAEGGKIRVTLMDKGILKDVVVGRYDFDLSYIYLQDKHLLLHKWVALNNPEAENYSEICGYVKLSINVSATGDE